MSKSWVSALCVRYRAGGYDALAPQSKRPHTSPRRVSDDTENAIITMRKHLAESGFDAGPHTIHFHLAKQVTPTPSVSTIWRVLKRRGFIVPEAKKQPKSSFIRFEAELPNECWQADVTHWALAGGTDVEILDFIDDHSRVIVAAEVRPVTKAADVVATFHRAASTWGSPPRCSPTTGPSSMQLEEGDDHLPAGAGATRHRVQDLGPYHPQTCGKIERWHQTLKKYLVKQTPAESMAELRPGRPVRQLLQRRTSPGQGPQTPRSAFDAREKAAPGSPIQNTHFRVRTDTVDEYGKVTLRHDSKLLHIGLGRRYAGLRIHLYVADLDVRVVTFEGELIRHLTLDPTSVYQPQD